MHKNACLLDILEIVQDFEADEDVLFQKLFVEERKQMDIRFNYIDASFRLFESSRDTIIVYLLDELDILRVFMVKNRFFSSTHADTHNQYRGIIKH